MIFLMNLLFVIIIRKNLIQKNNYLKIQFNMGAEFENSIEFDISLTIGQFKM